MSEDKEVLPSKEREISFGQIVLIKQGSDEKPPEHFIVLDPEKENGFIHTAKILEGSNNEKVLGGMGGAKPEDIREILDEKWTLEKIEDEVRKRFNYKALPKEMQEFLRSASQKPSGKI